MEAYYYSQMNKTQQSVYHAMKTGLTAMESSFAVPFLEGRELQDVFFKLRLDCPEIFYAVGFKYRYYNDAGKIEMIPEYLFQKRKVKEHQKAMETRVTKLVRPAAAMTECEKEQYIHDFICRNVHYDKLKKPYSHEIIGPLGQGVGVCEGIAKTVKILCDALGLWCMIAVSDSNPEKGIKYRHAWNIVRIGGVYYHLDVTFDNTLGHDDTTRYDYFNLDDKRFFLDHEPVMYQAPQCSNGDHFYYKERKLSFTKAEDLTGRVQQAIRRKKILVFHWRGGYLSRAVMLELLGVIQMAAHQKEMHARVSVNRAQAVLHVTFTELMQEDTVVDEDAIKHSIVS
ncbi:MAG: transglutaminase domain-containing protein [Lachnospiraceae bacterium]